MFSVLPLHDGAPVSCEPTRGRIAEASSKEIEITCYFDEPGSHDFPLCVKLRGGKIIKCRVTAEAIVLVVSVKQKRFTFDDVFVASKTIIDNLHFMVQANPPLDWATVGDVYFAAPSAPLTRSASAEKNPRGVKLQREPHASGQKQPAALGLYSLRLSPEPRAAGACAGAAAASAPYPSAACHSLT